MTKPFIVAILMFPFLTVLLTAEIAQKMSGGGLVNEEQAIAALILSAILVLAGYGLVYWIFG